MYEYKYNATVNINPSIIVLNNVKPSAWLPLQARNADFAGIGVSLASPEDYTAHQWKICVIVLFITVLISWSDLQMAENLGDSIAKQN